MRHFCSQKNKPTTSKQTESNYVPTPEDRDKRLTINKTQLEWVY